MTGERIVIVASGLRDIGGHNYSYTTAVGDEFERRGFGVEVLAHETLSMTLVSRAGYRAVFSRGTYDFPCGKNALHSLLKLWSQADVYASELNSALGFGNPPPKVIFCHTLSDFELVGWSRLLRRRALPAPLILMMRETPGFETMGWYRRWLHPYTGLRARALAAINRRARAGFILATDTELLSADYLRIFRGRVVTFPLPVASVANRLPDPAKPSGEITFGYLGDCRSAKGFGRLAPMIEEVLTRDRGGRIKFVVQLYQGTYDSGAAPPGWDALLGLAERFPSRLELIKGALDGASYERFLASLDAVLIPNDHPGFRAGSSNVFSESVAAGKPVVVADGTWMASQLGRYGGGVTFSLSDSSGFADSVLHLARDWREADKRAGQFSDLWRTEHSAAKLVDAILESILLPLNQNG